MQKTILSWFWRQKSEALLMGAVVVLGLPWLVTASLQILSLSVQDLCVCVFVSSLVCVLAAQACLTLCNCMDCSPPGSPVHGILQARILEWVAIPFSRGSSPPRDRTQVSCTAGGSLPPEPPGASLLL